jgi:hypothetical protein
MTMLTGNFMSAQEGMQLGLASGPRALHLEDCNQALLVAARLLGRGEKTF